MEDIRDIFKGISEHYSEPVKIGGRCEAHTYYRISDLSPQDLLECAAYISERIYNVCLPSIPEIIISLPGSYSGLAGLLSQELASVEETLPVMTTDDLRSANPRNNPLKGKSVILVNDVITTARSSLEIHGHATLLGATVLCWASLIDRTFGPGPVPVVAAYTGEPVTLLTRLG